MDILENFSLSKPYKFCIYLSSVVLVSSLLSEPSNIDIISLRKSCFWLIVIGLIAWIIENSCYDIENYMTFKRILNSVYLFIGLLIVNYFF
jgi:hypothetical protein